MLFRFRAELLHFLLCQQGTRGADGASGPPGDPVSWSGEVTIVVHSSYQSLISS